LNNVSWQQLYRLDSCVDQANFFYTVLAYILDCYAPVETCIFKENDRPWVTLYFKRLIARRQYAFASGQSALYKSLRNSINRVRKSLQHQYYLDKINDLKHDNPAKWWNNLKSICRFNGISKTNFDNITYQCQPVPRADLPSVINQYLVDVTTNTPALNQMDFNILRDSLDLLPDQFCVHVDDVFNRLQTIKLRKAIGPDEIPNKILKEMAGILAPPITSILNNSMRQGVVPQQWKTARITPLPKSFPPSSVERDIRPIAVTNTIAKVCESLVGTFFSAHFANYIDSSQFGCTSKQSTTHALLKLTDQWFKGSESSRNITRILFVDFSKAFDLINHNILLRKFKKYNFPEHVAVWSLDFLQNRQQFVRISQTDSDWLFTHAGSPQGTIAGPNDFNLLINDHQFDCLYAKYVDDTTLFTTSIDPDDNLLQKSADQLAAWSHDNSMILNEVKTKEMILYFGKGDIASRVEHININGVSIEKVDCFKLLGVMIQNNLSWDAHVQYMLAKVSKRMYCIRSLVHAGVIPSDIVIIYCSVIRSVLEYACPVWHPGLTQKQDKDIERVQKRSLKLIFPELTYTEALAETGLEKLSTRRENITQQMFQEIKDSAHPLHYLLPKRDSNTRTTRHTYPFKIPITKSSRYARSFIPYCISHRY